MGKNHKKIIIAASGAVAMALSLCACQVGGSTSAPAESKAASDTITMMNYPDWIGENEASAFKDETGYTLKQVSTPDGGDSAWVNIIRQNSGSYDMSLAGMKVAETLDNAGLLEEFDASEVPNLKNIDSQYTEAFPWVFRSNRARSASSTTRNSSPILPLLGRNCSNRRQATQASS